MALIALTIASGVFAFANAEETEIPTQCPENDPGNTTIRLKHESDCSKYYECLRGAKILRVCPYRNEHGDRLHFNPALQNCAWPNLAVCEDDNWNRPRVCPKNLKRCIRIPHETDCAKFYLCDYDREEEVQCADGLHFNPVSQMCDYRKNAGCEISCCWKCCPPKGSDVEVRLPHECSCAKYYECEDGEQVARQCPKGQHFDNRLKRCRPAEEAGCIVRPTAPPSDAVVKCPEDKANGVKLPHESDCDRFYECTSGEMILRRCRAGRSFNPHLGVCDHPSNIPCDVSRCCNPEAFTVRPATPLPPDEDRAGPLPLEKDPDCPADGAAKLPFPTNCTLYYNCENGWKTLHSCPWGLYFNPLVSQCDWPFGQIICDPNPADLALLRSGLPASEDSPDYSKTVCHGRCPLHADPKRETAHLPADDCTKFCKCSNGVPRPMKCPRGLRYDRKERVCNWPWAVKCEDDLAKNATAADPVR